MGAYVVPLSANESNPKTGVWNLLFLCDKVFECLNNVSIICVALQF